LAGRTPPAGGRGPRRPGRRASVGSSESRGDEAGGPMTRFVLFRPVARAEYDHEVAYYEKQQKDLGKEFSAVIDECLTEIVFTPLRYAAVVDDIRECLVPRFPFAMYFRVS